MTVLFVCTHNSARSQMAEGLLRAAYGDRFEVMSAGTEPGGVNPLAIQAMRDLGIDITRHRSQHIDAFAGQAFDYVVTVCDHAREACPYVPAAIANLHESFPDPSAAEGTEAERLAVFRDVRDQIQAWIDTVFVPRTA